MTYLEAGQILAESRSQKVIRRTKLAIANRFGHCLATGSAREVLEQLEENIKRTSALDITALSARQLIYRNTLALGGDITLKPSAFHRDTFLRDAFLISQFADSPLLDQAILDMFGQLQDQETGYIPTCRFAFGGGGFRFADESTYYYLPLAYQTQYERSGFLTDNQVRTGRLASLYIINLLNSVDPKRGKFVANQTTTRTYWADELILPENDVVSFKQGLAAIALEAALRCGFIKDQSCVERAKEGYRRLAQAHGDRLPLSLKTGWIDVSALYPESFANLVFGEKILDDNVVKRTISSFATPTPQPAEAADLGLRVIRDQNGQYLDERHFINPGFPHIFMDQPGDYQNGGTWLVWDYAAWATALYHELSFSNLPEHISRIFNGFGIKDRAFLEFDSPEYLRTGLTGKVAKKDYQDPQRIGQTWNVSILDQSRRLARIMGARDKASGARLLL